MFKKTYFGVSLVPSLVFVYALLMPKPISSGPPGFGPAFGMFLRSVLLSFLIGGIGLYLVYLASKKKESTLGLRITATVALVPAIVFVVSLIWGFLEK